MVRLSSYNNYCCVVSFSSYQVKIIELLSCIFSLHSSTGSWACKISCGEGELLVYALIFFNRVLEGKVYFKFVFCFLFNNINFQGQEYRGPCVFETRLNHMEWVLPLPLCFNARVDRVLCLAPLHWKVSQKENNIEFIKFIWNLATRLSSFLILCSWHN